METGPDLVRKVFSYHIRTHEIFVYFWRNIRKQVHKTVLEFDLKVFCCAVVPDRAQNPGLHRLSFQEVSPFFSTCSKRLMVFIKSWSVVTMTVGQKSVSEKTGDLPHSLRNLPHDWHSRVFLRTGVKGGGSAGVTSRNRLQRQQKIFLVLKNACKLLFEEVKPLPDIF